MQATHCANSRANGATPHAFLAQGIRVTVTLIPN